MTVLAGRGVASIAMLSILFSHATARAQLPLRQCIDAHVEGQLERTRGHLLAARHAFLACADDECPAVIRSECADFKAQVDAALPSVVFAAVTPSGRDVGEVRVRIDDQSVWLPLDGRAIEVDPGQHRFTFVSADGTSVVLSALMREAEKYRGLSAAFGAPQTSVVPALATDATAVQQRPAVASPVAIASEADPTSARRPSALVYLFGGGAIAGLGAFAAFSLSGRSKQSELERCAPGCRRAEAKAMYDRYLAADVSLGVAAACLGLSTYFWFARRSDASLPRQRLDVSLDPRGGAAFSLSREF